MHVRFKTHCRDVFLCSVVPSYLISTAAVYKFSRFVHSEEILSDIDPVA